MLGLAIASLTPNLEKGGIGASHFLNGIIVCLKF